MAGVLLVNDIHLSDRPPSACTETYAEDLFALLRAIAELARKTKASAVIWAGDVFHSKIPARTSHATVKALIEAARAHPCPVLVVPGNHDLTHDRLDSLDHAQPLGVLFASGAVTMLDRWSAADDGVVNLALYGVPWLKDFTDETVGNALADWRSRLFPSAAGLVITHAPLYPPGQELVWENYPATAWAKAMDNHGTVHYGHVHEPHGIYTVDGVTFSNPGALSRGSLHEHNLTRPVSIAAWDSDTGEITHHVLPSRPAKDVFRLAEISQSTATQQRLDAFLATIGQTRIEVTSIEAVVAHVRGMDLGAELEALVAELLAEGASR
jgi:DNA repair exonuclease SbcCD nuclease subunit